MPSILKDMGWWLRFEVLGSWIQGWIELLDRYRILVRCAINVSMLDYSINLPTCSRKGGFFMIVRSVFSIWWIDIDDRFSKFESWSFQFGNISRSSILDLCWMCSWSHFLKLYYIFKDLRDLLNNKSVSNNIAGRTLKMLTGLFFEDDRDAVKREKCQFEPVIAKFDLSYCKFSTKYKTNITSNLPNC